jgi:hypothetical protein
MESSQPVHTDRQRNSGFDFLRLGIIIVLIVMGILTKTLAPFLFALALLLFNWLTRHRLYEIFPDRLVVHYGKPRKKTIPLNEIAEVRPMKLPFGGQGIMIKRNRGIGLLLRPMDPDAFFAHLDANRDPTSD